MQTAVNISRLITAPLSQTMISDREERLGFEGLFRHCAAGAVRAIHTTETASRLAAELISVAERAHARRELDTVRSAGEALANLPLPARQRSVGLFYQALVMPGGRDIPARARMFERLADEAPGRYRAKALLALGIGSMHSADYKAALFFLREAMNLMTRDRRPDPATALFVNKSAALVLGSEGDHQGALACLQSLHPLARAASFVDEVAYPNYLNSLAVELGEVGRLEEARRVSQMTLASPLAPAYPEWAETLADIEVRQRGASRSIVIVPPVPEAQSSPVAEAQLSPVAEAQSAPVESLARIVSWPANYCQPVEATPLAANHSASIVSLHDWKRKIEAKSAGGTWKRPTSEEVRSMDFTEKQAAITRCVYAEEVNEETLDSILRVAIARDTGDGGIA